jgi:hypothetical protein
MFEPAVSIEITYQTCINCGVAFGLPSALDKKLQETHRDFYCPNGHAAAVHR